MILIPIKKKNNNILYFDNDEAFYNWCVVPQLKTCEYTDNLGNIKYFNDFLDILNLLGIRCPYIKSP